MNLLKFQQIMEAVSPGKAEPVKNVVRLRKDYLARSVYADGKSSTEG